MHPKNEALLKRLTEVTQQGSVTWRETSLSDQFIVSLGSGSVLLSRKYVSVLGEISPCTEYIMTITDVNGNEVDTVSIINSSKLGTSARIDFGHLKNLYNLVSRNVRRVDQTIDSLLSDLG